MPTSIIMSLLESTLKSSSLVVLAFGITALLRKAPAALRHLVWVMAIGGSLVIPLLPTVLPAWRILPVVPTFHGETTSNFSMDTAIIPAALNQPEPARTKISTAEPPSPATVTKAATVASVTWQALSISLWLLGTLCWAGYYAFGRIQLRRLAGRSNRLTNAVWQSEIEAAAARMKVRRSLTLLCSTETEIPLTFGVIRPKVVLPIDASEWRLQRVRAVIQHEMAHVARLDALTLVLSHIACAVYWFNPIVWLAAGSAQFERERACDDQVLAAGSVPSEYASDLLDMATQTSGTERHAVALAMTRRSQIEGRLVALLNPGLSHQNISRSKTLLIAGIAALLVLPLAAISSGLPPIPAPPVIGTLITPPATAMTAVAATTVPTAATATPRQKPPIVTSPSQRLTGFECDSRNGNGSSHIGSHSNSDRNFHSWDVEWSTPGCTTTLNSQGEIIFDDNYTTIQKISPDGYVDITSTINGDLRHLNIRPSQNGALTYVWSVNGIAHDFDDAGRNWLANFLIAMDRKTGDAVNQRFPRLLQEGGAQRVLEEVSYMDSGSAREVYLLKLLHETALSPQDVQLVMARAAEIPGDYQRSRVLIAMASQRLVDAGTQANFLKAANEIKSDYEHSRTLIAFLEMRTPDDAAALEAIRAVPRIKSDYEASRVLIAAARQRRIEGDLRQEYVTAAQGIHSESARNQALRAIGYRP